MFSFHTAERYTQDPTTAAAGGLVMDEAMREVEEEERASSAMDEESGEGDDGAKPMDEEDAHPQPLSYAQYVFPEPTSPPLLEYANDNGCDVRFLPDRIPPTLPVITPNVLLGLSSIAELTAGQKRTVCGHTCLPMVVHSSPLVALIMSRVASKKQQAIPWKSRYISWMQGTFQLRELMLAACNGIIPFHESVTDEFVHECHREFRSQMASYEYAQDERIQTLFAEARANPANTHAVLMTFIDYLEEYALYYVHSLEQFLFRTLIEPHGHGLTLADVLTPNERPSLDQCSPLKRTKNAPSDRYTARQLAVDFFLIKVPAVLARDAQVASQPDYVARQTFDLQQLPYRVEVHPATGAVRYNVPAGTVWRGYISLQTIYEYWLFCDTEHVLGDDWAWDPNTWRL